MNVQALPSSRHSSTVAVDINVLVQKVFVLVSIMKAIILLCIISCLCLLDGHLGGIRSSYMWIWGVTSGYSIIMCTYMCYCMYVWFVVSLCQAVCGYALVWPVIRGVTLSDYVMATGFGPFNLPTCGPLPKGREHSYVESGKHDNYYLYVSVVYCCCGCLFVAVVCCLESLHSNVPWSLVPPVVGLGSFYFYAPCGELCKHSRPQVCVI